MFMKSIFPENSGVTLLLEHLPSGASEIDYFEIFIYPRENQLAWQFLVKFNFSIVLSHFELSRVPVPVPTKMFQLVTALGKNSEILPLHSGNT